MATKGFWGRIGLFAATMMTAAFATAASAADLSPVVKAPVQPVTEQSPWMIRLRALGVLPMDGGNVQGVAGSNLSYSNSITPELDISYFLTKNVALELILGTTKSNIYGQDAISSLGKIGSTWILPPTLTLQYHFTELGAFKPYVGFGVNYTFFYNTSTTNSVTSLSLQNTWGWALQAGFDYMFDKHWGINVDVKKIFLTPSFDVGVGATTLPGQADLNPWLVAAGVTYRF
ncbi:OmpW/AlkL family protein [Aquabacter sp. L1I39]|uniref:OmpW/AlkL family protein n=1 Tax=Aquabacter sp. L1I39 TaxID=2820278 RepID=UPI001FFC398C|nr:OmpW family protein [Aquabacter sp. L1I39]